MVSIIVTWVRTGAPFVVPSAMSRPGIDAMTKSLAVEWGRHGIRLNAIAPGTIPTEGMFARLRPGENNPEERIAQQSDGPRRHGGGHRRNLAAFLLRPRWINGETIALDGGGWLTGGGGFQDYLALDRRGLGPGARFDQGTKRKGPRRARVKKYCVVPANAGTHNPGRLMWRKMPATAPHRDDTA